MRACIRFLLLLAGGRRVRAPGVGAAQATRGATAAAADLSPATRTLALQRFRVLVIRDGLVLTPRRGEEKTIEIANGSIAVDGKSVSGRELRDAARRRRRSRHPVVVRVARSAPRRLRPACRTASPAPAPAGDAGARRRHRSRPPVRASRRRRRRIASGGGRAARR